MPRIKKKFTYTITPEIEKEFSELAKGKSINKSSWVEERMKEFIVENKKQ